MVKLPVLLFYEDTLNIVPKNAMWIYLWQDERIVSLANMDNPLPVSQMYQTMRFPYSNSMDDAIKTFTDLGYKIWDNPAPLAFLYTSVVRYMMEHK